MMGYHPVAHHKVMVGHHDIRIRLQGTGHIPTDGIGFQIVILVDIQEIIAGSVLHTCPSGSCQPMVPVVIHNLHGILTLRVVLCHLQHHLDALVFGTVVHKDIFHILVGLFKERPRTLGDILFATIHRYTDRDLDILFFLHLHII